MRNATTTETACPRCDDHGHVARYAHVQGGVCFRCGRRAGAARAVPTDRDRVITGLHNYLLAGRSRAAGEERNVWAIDAADAVAGLLSVAPADVRDRALAAFGAILAPAFVAEFARPAARG